MPIPQPTSNHGLLIHQLSWKTRSGVDHWSYRGDGTDAWGMDRLDGVSGFGVDVIAGRHLFRAPNGDHFDTVREMFSRFRLRSCRCDRQTDELEQMRTVLTLLEVDAHRDDQRLLVDNGFGGSRAFMEHYVHWLEAEAFVDCTGTRIADVNLTAEGRSALLMLRRIRPGSNVDTSAEAVLARHLARTKR